MRFELKKEESYHDNSRKEDLIEQIKSYAATLDKDEYVVFPSSQLHGVQTETSDK